MPGTTLTRPVAALQAGPAGFVSESFAPASLSDWSFRAGSLATVSRDADPVAVAAALPLKLEATGPLATFELVTGVLAALRYHRSGDGDPAGSGALQFLLP